MAAAEGASRHATGPISKTFQEAQDMKTLRLYIEAKGCQFARHPLFPRLELMRSIEDVRVLATALSFWVMNYQDLLRLNEDRMEDPSTRKLARLHRAEEAGHERWFLEDLQALEAGQPDLPWIFGAHHTPVRDATHALLAEVYRARTDADRLALLLVCEATGKIFFDRVDARIRRLGLEYGLQFFSGSHPEAERMRSIFEEKLEETVSTFILSGANRDSAFAMVDRAFGAFSQLLDGVDVALVRAGLSGRSPLAEETPAASAA